MEEPATTILVGEQDPQSSNQNTQLPREPKKFGTFQGVFTPTVLTILGVIMYLREGWVVGNAGLLGAIGIITLATVITLFTSLSMSSITTNIRIKAGGAFSIISQSLGLEAGGAIGIPLYIAQALAVAMYIFGFRDGWLWLFPDHPALLVDIVTFLVIFLVINISTDFAFKIQYVILVIILLSLVSIGMAFIDTPINTEFEWFGTFAGAQEGSGNTGFWLVFAVYFPAVTGIMAGANMSGDLKDPRKSIPVGTLTAVGLSYFVYIALAIVLALIATPEELLSDYNILINKAYWAPIVLAGLLGATFSSALSSLVGAPRILYALGQNNILFWNKKLARTNKKGEPYVALLITTVIVLLALLMRNLNAIAPLLSMFFLITYCMINVVVLVEQSLGQISFRPTLKIPIIIPLLGTLGCLFVMFIINPTVSFISFGLVLAVYVLLVRKQLETEEGDTRSGIFTSVAEWAAKMVTKLPEAGERSWQPNLLIPARDANDVIRSYRAIYNVARPKGSIKILGFVKSREDLRFTRRLKELTEFFSQQGVSASYAPVQSENYQESVITSMQSYKASFFRPNTIFLSLSDNTEHDPDISSVAVKARNYQMGVFLFAPYKKLGLALEKNINLWLDESSLDTPNEYKVENINLALLTSYLLQRNWKGRLRVLCRSTSGTNEEELKEKALRLFNLARITSNLEVHFYSSEDLSNLPGADLHIFSSNAHDLDIEQIRDRSRQLEASCLITIDGGLENALA